jgi:hypothetical protein
VKKGDHGWGVFSWPCENGAHEIREYVGGGVMEPDPDAKSRGVMTSSEYEMRMKPRFKIGASHDWICILLKNTLAAG